MIICQICMEIFTTRCDTYSTVCGHVFHNICLNNWLDRGEDSCPSCRNPCRHSTVTTGIHKIYLHFDPEYEPKIKKLTDEIAVLKMQLRNSEQRVFNRNARAAGNRELTEDEKFDLDVVNAENMSLMDENETLHKIIDLTEADLKEKKEIIYAMNSILDDMEAADNRARNNNCRDLVLFEGNVNQDQVDRLRSDLARSRSEDPTKKKCIVTGVKLEDLDGCTTTEYVIALGLLGKLKITENDIFSVEVQFPKHPRGCSMFVVFKTFEMKQKFLALKPHLPKNLNVQEALSRESLALFNCAKSLKRCGYKSVYHSMGNVYAKRSNDHPAIHITSLNHVKELRSGSKGDYLSTPFNELL